MEEKLLELAREILNDPELGWDTKRSSCDSWDSAAHLILLSELEEEFEASIPLEEVESIETISDFLRYIPGGGEK